MAETYIDIWRVRNARHQLLAEALHSGYLRRRGRALARIAGRSDGGEFCGKPFRVPIADLRALKELQSPDTRVLVIKDLSAQLSRLERYERRARSRRKFALEAFDEARRSISGL
jgi:hypothetical protein